MRHACPALSALPPRSLSVSFDRFLLGLISKFF
ncbi:hypothetical protein CO2235_MP80404 [Cupriavidus oxalaticus]|uniref:Uncharacterized protein n=1 Tax=Cupriavidus oxalaticus TaxID=96344 RepID=A0A976BKJ4_9BURK|nr:hypothetical protein CO2235_MP80404 [Cupriavidus oxalaticus]